MKFIIFHLFLVIAYVIVNHILSDDGFTVNWLLAYGLFCSPFFFLLISSYLVQPHVVKIYSGITWAAVLIGAALVISNNTLYVLPALAWVLLIFSALALLISLVVKGVAIAFRRNQIT